MPDSQAPKWSCRKHRPHEAKGFSALLRSLGRPARTLHVMQCFRGLMKGCPACCLRCLDGTISNFCTLVKKLTIPPFSVASLLFSVGFLRDFPGDFPRNVLGYFPGDFSGCFPNLFLCRFPSCFFCGFLYPKRFGMLFVR